MIFSTTYPPKSPRPAIGGYRYSFNGQEADNEVLVAGALHAFEYLMHDTRIGRFWSVDPLAGKFPWNSTYAFAENQVVEGRELEGLEVYYITTEFGSAAGVGEYGLKFVRGQGRAKDKIGITYFKYKSSFKTTDQEAIVGLMLISLKNHFGIDFSSDFFRQSSNKGAITSVDAYPILGGSIEGREVDTYAGASFGFGLVAAHVTMKTEVTKSFSITYEEQTSLINLVKEKGFEYNNVEPKFKVINHYLYYIDRGDLFNLFKDTPIKTDIKMVEVGKDQWESERYQRQVKEKQSK